MNDAETRVIYGLESQHPLQPNANYLRLEGWGFVEGGTAPPVVRLRIEETIFSPESTLDRHDVADRFPSEEHISHCGFEFVVLLPMGLREGVLEISGDGGTSWHKACDLLIPTTPHPIMGEFEPAGEDGIISEATRLAGWCWHPELTIDQVIMIQGNTEVPVDWGLERNDVATRFPDQPAARYCGFMTKENLPRGRGEIRLQISTACGRTFFLRPGLSSKIKNGAFAPPRPPPEMWKLSFPRTAKIQPTRSDRLVQPGPTNILFVLHGDFTANSAYHVTALANELIARGYDCVVAVPEHVETIEAQPGARFLAIEFGELDRLSTYFRDGKGPQLTHLWTPRELVRKYWQELEQKFESEPLVHLEDNEEELLREHLALSEKEFDALSDTILDEKVPEILSHPHRALALMRQAAGITTIFESLADHVPSGTPHQTFWPAATTAFTPLPIDQKLRASLGIPASGFVVFYHGNTHGANTSEVGELYQAIEKLNEAQPGSVWLVRTGRDSQEFADAYNHRLGLQLIHLGFVKRSRDLPKLMCIADAFVQPGSAGAFNDFRFPSKLPEFFAIGRPVVLPRSNVGKRLTHLQDAYVLDQADAAGIAEALSQLAEDTKLCERLAAGAITFAKNNFSWSKSSETLIEFYHKVTSLASPSQRQVEAAQILNHSFNRESHRDVS